jgi:pyruvate dehydrogenase E2 component (dihydrolipoyllysine-residue acetyltransferase)
MDVLMPQLGETVAEGKITQWFKSAGDAIQPGDNLFEIETDKVSMEVPSTTGGVLAEIRVPAGAVAPVGAVVAVIADSAEAGAAASPAAAPRTATSAIAQPPSDPHAGKGGERQTPLLQRMAGMASFASELPPTPPAKLDPFREVRTPDRNYGPAKLPGGIVITPLARRLAAEARLEPAHIKGSGPLGRIVARDVERARALTPPTALASPPHPPPHAGKGREGAAGPGEIAALYRDTPLVEVPLDAMRVTIAKRLVHAAQTVPHFYLSADIEIAGLLELREAANADAANDADGKQEFKLSLNDLLIKAWAAALQRVPEANAVWAQDRILRLKHSDIAVAVALEGGLITPIIRKAETKSLSSISNEMKDLAARGRERKLQPNEYQGGSSTISNLGMYGVREFAAVINVPQATILAVGAARRQAVEEADGGVRFASVMSVTLSCDHRVVDGALGAQLLAAFKSLVEKPTLMLV